MKIPHKKFLGILLVNVINMKNSLEHLLLILIKLLLVTVILLLAFFYIIDRDNVSFFTEHNENKYFI